MSGETYEFESELWAWEARKDFRVFATVPTEASEEIAGQPRPPSGFGAVRVRARLGESTWQTSIFPGAQRGYALPIKQSVRARAGVGVGDTVAVTIELL